MILRDYWYSLGSNKMISAATVFALNLDLQIQAYKFVTWSYLQLLLGLKVLWRLLLSSVGCHSIINIAT